MWTAELASEIAPELSLMGAMAAAPAARLGAGVNANWDSVDGWALGPPVIKSWSEAYPDRDFEAVLSGAARRSLGFLTSECTLTDGLFGLAEKALIWLTESEGADPKERSQAARAAFVEWLKTDRDRAVAWAESLTEEQGRAAWFAQIPGLIVSSISWHEPQEALKWVHRIHDAKRRELALITISRRWRDIDADAAERWLEDSPLSDEARERARQYPVNYRRRAAHQAEVENGED